MAVDLLADLSIPITPENSVYNYNTGPYTRAVAEHTALNEKREQIWDAAIAANGGVYPGGTAAQLLVLAPEIAAAAEKVRLYESRIRQIESFRQNKTPEQIAAAEEEIRRITQASLEQRLIETGHPWEVAGPVIVKYADGTVFAPKQGEYAPNPNDPRQVGIAAPIPPDPSLPTLGPTDAPGGVPRPGTSLTVPQTPMVTVTRALDLPPVTVVAEPPNPAMAAQVLKWALIAVGVVVLLALATSARRR